MKDCRTVELSQKRFAASSSGRLKLPHRDAFAARKFISRNGVGTESLNGIRAIGVANWRNEIA